jgi:MATE family multidrug resistance protein
MDSGSSITGVKAAWRDELRSTLALAWPLILANVTQQAIQATDVLLMGRLGATQLAAATLALNLTFTVNLLILGLLIASSPMMATALGQRFNAVRDVRRTFRAGLWLLIIALPPYWLLLWQVGTFMRWFGEAPELAEQGQPSSAPTCGAPPAGSSSSSCAISSRRSSGRRWCSGSASLESRSMRFSAGR